MMQAAVRRGGSRLLLINIRLATGRSMGLFVKYVVMDGGTWGRKAHLSWGLSLILIEEIKAQGVKTSR